MADNKKISQLSIVNSWTNLKSTDIIPLVASNTTSQVSLDKLVTYITQWSAKTGSNTFIGGQSINGSLTVSNDLLVNGTLTVKKMMVDVTSASVIYQDGSTKFGDTINDTHEYTGSLKVSGSISLLGANIGTILYNYTSSTNAIHTYTGSLKSSISVSGTDTQIIGNLTASNFRVTGNTVLGDASTDSTTINGSIIALGTISGPAVSAYTTTGSNIFKGDQIVTGSIYSTLPLTVGTTRTIVLGTTGNISIQPNTGNWEIGLFFNGSSGTTYGGFGSYGSNDSLSYYFVGDSYLSNGIRVYPTTNVASFSGNVGIGATSPSAKLHITTGSQTILIGTGSNTSAYTLSIGANDDGVNFSNNSAGRGYNFNNANGTHLKIDSTGNTGIGTTTPGAKLDISGSVQIQNTGQLKLSGSLNQIIAGSDTSFIKISGGSSPSTSNGSGIYLSGNTEANTGRLHLWSGNVAGNHIRFDTSATERIRIDNVGNVGIATTSPTSKLDILSNSTSGLTIKSADTNNSYVEFGIDTNSGRAIINSGKAGTGATRKISFRTDDTPRMTIDTTGNVGIGTETPSEKLEVVGNINVAGSVTASDGFLGTTSNSILFDGAPSSTYAKRGAYTYTNLLAGNWYTIATNSGNRASAKFILNDLTNGAHQSVHFYASHMYGSGNEITLLHGNRYSTSPYRYIRIKDGGTLDGAMLQIYIDSNSTNGSYVVYENDQTYGWTLCPPTLDGVDPGGLGNFTTLTTIPVQIDIDQGIIGGGGNIITTGDVYAGGKLVQYKLLDASEITGSTNYVSKFTGANTVGNSIIYDNGTKVGIGTESPTANLDIVGTLNVSDSINGIDITRGATPSEFNTGIGSGALQSTTGVQNSALGYHALFSNTTGTNNVAAGTYALANSVTGNYNVGIGVNTLVWNTSQNYSVAIGHESQRYVSSSVTTAANTSIGYQALMGSTTPANNTGIQNVAVGYQSLYKNTSGMQNIAIGVLSLNNNTTQNGSVAIGHQSQYYITANSNVAGNVSLGYNSLRGDTTLPNTGVHNTAIGEQSLQNTHYGFNNTSVGYQSLYNNTSGSYNVAVGAYSLLGNVTGQNTIGIGYSAGRFIANGTTANDDSNYSIYIGRDVKSLNTTTSNEIVIGYNAIGIGSNTVVLGNDSITTTALKGNVGIGTTAPTDELHVVGNSRFDGGLRYALRVLTANTTLTTSDTYIIGNGAITLTMPSATTAGAGFTLYIKNIHASSNVTVSRAGADTFDGSSTPITVGPLSSTTLVSNGSNTWYIFYT